MCLFVTLLLPVVIAPHTQKREEINYIYPSLASPGLGTRPQAAPERQGKDSEPQHGEEEQQVEVVRLQQRPPSAGEQRAGTDASSGQFW